MEITTITVKYALTHNMGNYSNIRPEVELTARLEPTDDPDESRWLLLNQAKEAVHAEVDAALEADDEAPKYYTGPRFSLATLAAEKLAVVFPDKGILPAPWDEGTTIRCTGRRLSVVLAKAMETYPGYLVINCSDGDYSCLAAVELERFLVFISRERKLSIVTLSGVDRDTLPGGAAEWSYPEHCVRRKDTLLVSLRNGSNGMSTRNYNILDCTDGDLSKIPAVEPAAPDPAIEKPKRARRKKAEEVEAAE